ncbi:NADH/NAD(+) kinase KNAG_0I00280 [Huiozyma naganishii CBS 8797]|uniref:NAD+ kinase n=1 Tax=Huiozyma naganishii (strain ATCC MYA-139 / BCRC 22969 / CBS 8797 / KCTC 17520 / NBRC 10181 / NCYC 3082 / Yp74L-3) TaxID=1071383 RepID=J7S8Z0_HUIN7|nr:hypothetical protein KNAG_0I00280 [Kazachstania naganishii CBS 8797]CCK71819.1 hypothetical protein KNAG_0I00280 [Kazachstania naganishii CBS 8797]
MVSASPRPDCSCNTLVHCFSNCNSCDSEGTPLALDSPTAASPDVPGNCIAVLETPSPSWNPPSSADPRRYLNDYKGEEAGDGADDVDIDGMDAGGGHSGAMDTTEQQRQSTPQLESARRLLRKLSWGESAGTSEDDEEGTVSGTPQSGHGHGGELRAPEKSSNVHFQYANTAYDVRMLSKDISNALVDLHVENLMIVTKLNDVSLYYLTRELVEWLLVNFSSINVYVDSALKDDDKFAVADLYKDSKCKETRVRYWDKQFIAKHDVFFDLVVTLGGDGTVLFVSSIFQQHVPPVLSFSLGSLGFLTNYKFESFREILPRLLDEKIKSNLRLRLECKLYRRRESQTDAATGKKVSVVEVESVHHILNEVTIDRGPSSFITMLELYGDNSLMTVAQADGIIVATPTGSTAYSLSAGGSLIYPTVNAIAVTPICPHTLSFRPIILPDTIQLKIKVPLRARGTAWASFDGKDRVELQKGDYITVCASPYWFPTIESTPTEFINSISRTLNWNVREQQKSFTHMLSDKNKEKYALEKDKLATMPHSSSSEEDVQVVVPAKEPPTHGQDVPAPSKDVMFTLG